MIIQVADESDSVELTKVEIESKIMSIPECIGKSEIDYDLRLQRWHTYFKGESPASSRPARLILKAVADDTIAGYLAGHLTTRYQKDSEIQSFYILKQHQRNSLGKKLLANFLNWLLSKNAHSLCVGISPENKYKAFYLKYGGQYLNPHWIYWDDLATLLKRLS